MVVVSSSLWLILQGGWQVAVVGQDIVELSYTRKYLLDTVGLVKRRSTAKYLMKSFYQHLCDRIARKTIVSKFAMIPDTSFEPIFITL